MCVAVSVGGGGSSGGGGHRGVLVCRRLGGNKGSVTNATEHRQNENPSQAESGENGRDGDQIGVFVEDEVAVLASVLVDIEIVAHVKAVNAAAQLARVGRARLRRRSHTIVSGQSASDSVHAGLDHVDTAVGQTVSDHSREAQNTRSRGEKYQHLQVHPIIRKRLNISIRFVE